MKKRLTYILLGSLASLIMINMVKRGFGEFFYKFITMYKSIDFLFLYMAFISGIISLIFYLILNFIEKNIEKNKVINVIFNFLDIFIFCLNVTVIIILYFIFGSSI
jgi:hypothetical protein